VNAWDAEERRVAEAVAGLEDEDFHLDPPPPDLWDRIVAGVEDEEAAARPVPLRTARPRAGRWLAAAAAVVVAVVLAASLARLVAGPPADIEARARLTSEGLAARNDLVGSAALLDTDGHREIDLDLPGLPDAGGSYYELWLLAPDGSRLQSLGITTGEGRYAVPAGIDPRGYPLVDVSREPADGNPAHSGDSLVRGRLEL
jgi:anti-sigma-K factor RskA